MSTGTSVSMPIRDDGGSPTPTFVKHSTTNPAPVHPFIDTSIPSINSGAPVELDSTPVSPVARKESWKVHSTGTAASSNCDTKGHEDLNETLGRDESIKQRREQLLRERQKDPGVLVDIPGTPGPEEYGIAQAGFREVVARRSSVTGVTPKEVAAMAEEDAKS
ncbi:uncharacterized protein PV09_01733 [Verruconis gallopava]|uniref:Uncharacterized protein n=1 Tax=Verruconis gallopava TaxID=253628 RepID=A0A0D2AM16_9PEZI|nr:uncharacterized protein PV09_01733 [Verruconis gallopava]KIW07813.1 hypothetical protein PV09_01733 [Verruconis gallopava]